MTSEKLRVSRETLIRTVTALDTSFEQSVEKDFVLPDYCPDVFRILKCRVNPRIVSHSINGDKLTVETEAVVRVMYLSGDSGRINLLEQKLSFTKTLDLGGDCTAPIVCANARLDYVNCRVVNQRRVDIRGAYTVKVKVDAESRAQFVTGAEGGGIQLLRVPVVFPAKRLTASKRMTVIEELELGGAKPPVGSVLRTECSIERSEQKVISGKLITKGEATVELLYTSDDPGSSAVETMRFGLPFSQIIDVDGLDESYAVTLTADAVSCEVMPRADDGSRLECELVMLVNCTAVKYGSCDAVTDAFSTQYECISEAAGFSLGNQPREVCAEFSQTGMLASSDEPLAGIASAWCEVGNVTVREAEGRSVVSGSLTFSAIGTNVSGNAVWLENEVPFEFGCDSSFSGEAAVSVRSSSYHLADENTVEVKAELAVTGSVCGGCSVVPLSELDIDAEKPLERSRSYALKLCYVEAGEDLWQLAKRCRTSVDAIIEENELSSDKTEESGMLLIPLIN